MEEEAECRRQPPLKLEVDREVNQENSHKDRDREKRRTERLAEPIPQLPQKHLDYDDVEVEEDDYDDGEDSQGNKQQLKLAMRPITAAPFMSSASKNTTPNSPGNESPCHFNVPSENTADVQPLEEHRHRIGLSLKLGESRTKQSSQIHLIFHC